MRNPPPSCHIMKRSDTGKDVKSINMLNDLKPNYNTFFSKSQSRALKTLVMLLNQSNIKLPAVTCQYFACLIYHFFHFFPQINEWIKNVSDTNKNIVTAFKITDTYEGRPLMGIKVGIHIYKTNIY